MNATELADRFDRWVQYFFAQANQQEDPEAQQTAQRAGIMFQRIASELRHNKLDPEAMAEEYKAWSEKDPPGAVAA